MMMSENYYLACLTDSRLKAILKSGVLPHLVFTSEIQLTTMSVSQPHLEKAESSIGSLLLWFISTPSVNAPLWTFTLQPHPLLAWRIMLQQGRLTNSLPTMEVLKQSAPYCLCSMHPKQYGQSLDGILQVLSNQSWNNSELDSLS